MRRIDHEASKTKLCTLMVKKPKNSLWIVLLELLLFCHVQAINAHAVYPEMQSQSTLISKVWQTISPSCVKGQLRMDIMRFEC